MGIPLQRDTTNRSRQEGRYCKSTYDDTDFRIVELEFGKIEWKGRQEAVKANGEEKMGKKSKDKIFRYYVPYSWFDHFHFSVTSFDVHVIEF